MRTLSQNAYYWAIVIGDILSFYTKYPERFYKDAHDLLHEDGGKQVIHAMMKILHNGGHSTQFKDDKKGTGTEKMAIYIDTIRQHFWEKYQYDIPPANEPRMDNGS